MDIAVAVLLFAFGFWFFCWFGHLIWVGVFQRIFRSPRRHEEEAGTIYTGCHVCSGSIPSTKDICPYCGWRKGHAGPLVPTQITLRLMEELERRGLSKPSDTESLRRSIAQWIGFLTQPKPTPLIEKPLIEKPLAQKPLIEKPIESLSSHSSIVPVEPATDVPSIEPLAPAPPFVATQSFTPPAQVTKDYAQRLERFQAAKQVVEESVSVEKVAHEPRRTWTEWLGAFMEEKHIRWGEVIGGLLIVCCSIALVISFWSEIAERPILKFGVFNGITAALFGVGIHASRRWQLPTTSQGLLCIASLLVPLNFLAIAAFTGASGPPTPLMILGEVISMGVFLGLTYFAGRILVPQSPILFALSILVPSVLQLLIRRYVNDSVAFGVVSLFAVLTLVLYNAANLTLLGLLMRRGANELKDAGQLCTQLGMSSFATTLALALLVFKTGAIANSLQYLSPMAGIVAFPTLAIGLWLWQRVTSLGAVYQTVGAGLACFAALITGAGIVIAWPLPSHLMLATAISAILLTSVAILFRVSEGHLVASLGTTVCFMLICQVVSGRLSLSQSEGRLTLAAITSASSGNFLTLLAIGYAVIAWFTRSRKWNSSHWFEGIAGGVAALSLTLITLRGFGIALDPYGATWMYAVYTLAVIAAAAVLQRAVLAWGAGILAFLSLSQGIVYRLHDVDAITQPWVLAALLHASLMMLAAFALWFWCRRNEEHAARQWFASCMKTSSYLSVASVMLALSVMTVQRLWHGTAWSAVDVYWISILVLLLSIVYASSALFSVFQALLGLAIVLTVHRWLGITDDLAFDRWHLWQSNVMQWDGVALTAMVIAWMGVRWFIRERSGEMETAQSTAGWRTTVNRFLSPPWPTVDRAMLGIALGLITLLACASIAPGISQELMPREVASLRIVPDAADFELLGLSHVDAKQWPSILLVGLLTIAVVARMLESHRRWLLGGVAICVGSFCMLMASRFEGQVAVASALRWTSAFAVLLVSIFIWMYRPLVKKVPWLLPKYSAKLSSELRSDALIAMVAVTILPMLAMAVFLGIHALRLRQLTRDEGMLWIILAAIVGVVFVVWTAVTIAKGKVRDESRMTILQQVMNAVLVLCVAPLVAVTVYVIAASLGLHPIVGPEPQSFFPRLGLPFSYGIPLMVIAGVLVGHAMYQRSSRLGLAAGLMILLCAVTLYLLSGVGPLTAVIWIKLATLSAVVSSGYALCWMAYRQYRSIAVRVPWTADVSLVTQTLLGVGFNAMYLLPLLGELVRDPMTSFPLSSAASPLNWLAVISSALSVFWLMNQSRAVVDASPTDLATKSRVRRFLEGIDLRIAGVFAIACHALISFGEHGSNVFNWNAYHMFCGLMMGTSLITIALLLIANHQCRSTVESNTSLPARVLAWFHQGLSINGFLIGVVIVLGLRAMVRDPQSPWWSCALFFIAASLATGHSLLRSKQRYLYLAAFLVNLMVTFWWLEVGQRWMGTFIAIDGFFEFFLVNAMALALPVVLWRWCDHRLHAPKFSVLRSSPRICGFACHRFVTSASLVILSLVVGLGVFTSAWGHALDYSPTMGWTTVALCGLALAVCLWDRRARYATAGLYVLGLIIIGQTLEQLSLNPRNLLWLGTVLLACYGLGTSYLWSRRQGIAKFAQGLGVPQRTDDPLAAHAWITPANLLIALFVISLAFASQWKFESFTYRWIVAQSALVQALSIGLLSCGRRESVLRGVSLWIGTLGFVLLGWSMIAPGSEGVWIHRLIATGAALGLCAVLGGLGLIKIFKQRNEWTQAAQKMVPSLLVLALSALTIELGFEAYTYLSRGVVPISMTGIVIVGATLIGLTIASLVAALMPGRDPLQLTESQKQWYVYGAEALLGVLFLHVRLTVPEIFHGTFEAYWPFILMGIAFVGVAFGEFFRRQKQKVLSEPLTSTGALLPMLPVFGFWIGSSEVHYSLVMLTVGSLYGVLSALRRSFQFGAIAALAVNGALWYLLYESGRFGLLQHPQLWMIPPALCVLAATHLNRKRFNESQLANIRYLTSTVIYVSSTAELFINDVGLNPWLPVVLAGLSLAGIGLGIFLRIRAFLFMGTSFLCLALLRVIWYAAVDREQTWLWFVSGILAGAVILVVFALFEKKKQEVLKLVEGLKQWQA